VDHLQRPSLRRVLGEERLDVRALAVHTLGGEEGSPRASRMSATWPRVMARDRTSPGARTPATLPPLDLIVQEGAPWLP
jgi:hypothetical protein